MLYLFKDETTGELVEVSMPMADAPELGAVIEHEGRRLKRLVSTPEVLVEPDFRHVAHQLRDRENTPEHLRKDVPHWHRTKAGRLVPRFDTKREIVEYQARSEGAFNYDMRRRLTKPQALVEST